MSTSAAPEADKYVMGDGNVHTHTCPVGPHPWHCDSCYCNTMNTRCPEHGGATPKLNGSR